MNNLISFLSDIVFPRRCPFCDTVLDFGGAKVCGDCKKKLLYVGDDCCMKCGRPLIHKTAEYCPSCAKVHHSFDSGRSLFVYNDMQRRAIAGLKYKNKREYADFYAEELAEYFKREIAIRRPDALIPVPISDEKMKTRGYNQAELLAKGLGRIAGIPVRNDVLKRVRDTAPQKELNRAERQKNLKKAFKITADVVKLETIMVIDDIYTTGSTIDEISAVLKAAGVKRVFFLTAATGSAL